MHKMAEKLLTPGCVKKLNRCEYVVNPVLQYLNYIPPPSAMFAEVPHILIISDGSQSTAALLDPALHGLITKGKLKINSIICVDQYRFWDMWPDETETPPILTISKITIVKCGSMVGEVINGFEEKACPLIEFPTTHDDDLQVSAKVAAKLTSKCLQRIMRGKNIKNPVIQILRSEQFTSRWAFWVTISDGTDFCVAMLDPHPCNLILNGKMKNYSVVRLNEYSRLGRSSLETPELLMIHDLTVIERGEDVKGIIRSSLSIFSSASSLVSTFKSLLKLCYR